MLWVYCGYQSEDEREMCARTIYCTNIDKKVVYQTFHFFYLLIVRVAPKVTNHYCLSLQVTETDVKLFFESVCGEVCEIMRGKYVILLLFENCTIS